MMERRKGLIQRIVDGERLFPILAQRGEVSAEEVIQRWREEGYSPEAVKMAIKMSDNWLKKVTK